VTLSGPRWPRLSPLGDSALLVTFGDRIDSSTRDRVLALADRLGHRRDLGIVELVPATVSLAIRYDPRTTDYGSLRDVVQTSIGGPVPTPPAGRLITIPVRYDGPDLAEVAAKTGLTQAEVVARHSAREYQVALLGFVPGFGYLTALDPRLVLPRRSAPRPRVPAGSVAIAGEQTGIYPAATPGGWHLLGRTRTVMFDPARDPPGLLAVGDRVRFVAED